MMRVYLAAVLVATLCAATPARAQQLQVEVAVDDEQFLAHEQLTLGVRIVNFTGRPLTFGTNDEWLRFEIEGERNEVVFRTGPLDVRGEFKLESSNRATRKVDISRAFDIAKPGKYRVRATVYSAELGLGATSPPKSFLIGSGRTLWEQEFGVSVAGDAGPSTRRYSLVQSTHRDQIKLYFGLSDGTGAQVHRLFPISTMTSFSKPEAQIDKEGRLHVLNQDGARAFFYGVFGPDGQWILRQRYDYGATRPSLRPDADGRMGVNGGVRRLTRQDFPPRTEADPGVAPAAAVEPAAPPAPAPAAVPTAPAAPAVKKGK